MDEAPNAKPGAARSSGLIPRVVPASCRRSVGRTLCRHPGSGNRHIAVSVLSDIPGLTVPCGTGRGAGLSVQAAYEGSPLGGFKTGVFCLPSSFVPPFLELRDLGLGCFLCARLLWPAWGRRVHMAGVGFGTESKRGRRGARTPCA